MLREFYTSTISYLLPFPRSAPNHLKIIAPKIKIGELYCEYKEMSTLLEFSKTIGF